MSDEGSDQERDPQTGTSSGSGWSGFPPSDGRQPPDPASPPRPVSVARLPAVPLGLGPGVALVVALIWDLPLALVLLIAVFAGLLLAAIAWFRADDRGRSTLLRRIGIGALAGAAGTLAFDAVRGIASLLDGVAFEPYLILEALGGLLLGAEADRAALMAVGSGFHAVTGLGFAIALVLLLERPGVIAGLIYGLVLLSFLIVVYPNWVGTGGDFGGFVAVNGLAHVAYGLALGATSRWLVGRWERT